MADAIGQNVADVINSDGIIAEISKVNASITAMIAKINEANAVPLVVRTEGTDSIKAAYDAEKLLEQQLSANAKAVDQINDLQARLVQLEGQLAAAINQRAGATAQATGATQATTAAIQQEIDRLDQLLARMNRTNPAYTFLSAKAAGLRASLQMQGAATQQATTATQNLGSAITLTAAMQQQFTTATNQATGATQQFGTASNATASSVTNLGGSANRAGGLLGSFSSILSRAALRFVAVTLLIQGAIKTFQMFWQSVMQNIEGTKEWIQHQEKLQQANMSLQRSFEALGDQIDRANKELTEAYASINQQILQQGDLSAALDNTTEAYKRQLATIQAQGVQNGQTGAYDYKVLIAANKVREAELAQLKSQQGTNTRIQKALEMAIPAVDHAENIGQDETKVAYNYLKESGLSEDQRDKLKTEMYKQRQEGGNIKKPLEDAYMSTAAKGTQIAQQIADKENEIANAQLEYQAGLDRKKYEMSVQLTKQLADVQEQYRQIGEQEESASADKITADVKAKYTILYRELQQRKNDYLKSIYQFGNAGYSDKQTQQFDQQATILNNSATRDASNQIFDLQLSKVEEYHKRAEQENQRFYDESGHSYDDELILQYRKIDEQKKAYDKAYQLLEAAHQKQLLSDAEFQKRLQELNANNGSVLAQSGVALRKVNEQIDAENKKGQVANLDYLNELNSHREALTNIGADVQEKTAVHNTLMARVRLPDRKTQYDQQNIEISEGQENVRREEQQRKKAEQRKKDAEFSVNADETKPVEQMSDAELKKYEKDLQDKAQATKAFNALDIQEAKDAAQVKGQQDDLELQKFIDINDKRKQALKEIKDLAIQLADETAQAIITIQNNQFAVEQQNLEIKAREQEVASEQQVAAINAEYLNQVDKDNALQKQAAQSASAQNAIQQQQNALALKQAEFQKKSAEATILLKTAEGEMAVIAQALSDGTPLPLAIAEGFAVAAIGAVQYAAASSTPLPTFFAGGTTETPVIVAGERGPELGRTPAGEMVMFNTPGIYTPPVGTEIFDATRTDEMLRFATMNAGRDYQGGMQVNYAAAVFEMSANLGADFNKGTDKIVNELREQAWQARRNPPVSVTNIFIDKDAGQLNISQINKK